MDILEQIVIAVCGMTSVWLSQDKEERFRRWACIFGMVAQPFWMHATWVAGQWGIFALSFVYLAGWIRGFRVHWLGR